jgi:hypothetical protein
VPFLVSLSVFVVAGSACGRIGYMEPDRVGVERERRGPRTLFFGGADGEKRVIDGCKGVAGRFRLGNALKSARCGAAAFADEQVPHGCPHGTSEKAPLPQGAGVDLPQEVFGVGFGQPVGLGHGHSLPVRAA